MCGQELHPSSTNPFISLNWLLASATIGRIRRSDECAQMRNGFRKHFVTVLASLRTLHTELVTTDRFLKNRCRIRYSGGGQNTSNFSYFLSVLNILKTN